MKKLKHVLAIFIVLGIISGAAFVLQETSIGEKIFNRESAAVATPDTTAAVQDTTPFVEKLKNHLEVVQTQKSRKKREIWVLGNGRTITHYLLQAQRFLRKNGGEVLYMEELHGDPTVFQSASLDALTPEGDTLKLTLNVSDNIFKNNASYLSIAFQVTGLTPELIVALNELTFPYDLMVTPFGMAETFFPDLDRVKNKELVIWLLMESTSLDSRHNRYRPVRIHHTEQQIESVIQEAKTLVPNAKGIATRFAEQAVEHRQLLQATLEPAKENGLWFLDLSMNAKSKVRETCKDLSMACKTATPYNPSNSALDDYIKRKLKAAAKSGMSTIIIPLSEANIAKVKSIDAKAAAQGTTIVNLSTFMKY